jgi:hypothetical protein
LHEAGLEVACDSESGEHARERCGLQQDEHELERGVAGRKLEPRHLADTRQATDERSEEEKWKHHRRQQERFVREERMEDAPRHAARN